MDHCAHALVVALPGERHSAVFSYVRRLLDALLLGQSRAAACTPSAANGTAAFASWIFRTSESDASTLAHAEEA